MQHWIEDTDIIHIMKYMSLYLNRIIQYVLCFAIDVLMCKFIKVYKLLINCKKKKNYLIDEIEVL